MNRVFQLFFWSVAGFVPFVWAEAPKGVPFQYQNFVLSEFGKQPTPLCLKERCQRNPLEEETSNRMPASVGLPLLLRPPVTNFSVAQGEGGNTSSSPPYQVALIATDEGFFPPTLSVVKGTSLKIYATSTSDAPLCFVMDSFGIYRQIHSKQVQEIELTPQEAGIFTFYCPIKALKGTLFVREFKSRSAPPEKE